MFFKKKEKVSGSDENLGDIDDENQRGSHVDNINVKNYQ